MKFTEAIEDALTGLGKASAITAVVHPAVGNIAKQMGEAFRASGKERLEDFLTGDPETDRLVMSGVSLANEINSTVDWSSVPGDALKSAFSVLQAAMLIAAIL